jgi:uncharacterized protein
MTLHESIKKEIPKAMKARDAVRLSTLRSLITAMTNEVVSKKRKPDEYLSDEEAYVVIKRASNQRKDSIEHYEKADRGELAENEKNELAILEALLPKLMGREEIEVIVKNKMQELGMGVSVEKAQVGKLTGTIMSELKGKADGAEVKAVIDSLLE